MQVVRRKVWGNLHILPLPETGGRGSEIESIRDKYSTGHVVSVHSIWEGVTFLKGQCHKIFDFWFFSWISFPQATKYINRAVSNFFENLRRYSQLKVHHWCPWPRGQMEKSSIRKVLIILFGHLWEVELTYRYIFAFKFTLRSQHPDIVPIIWRRCGWYWWQIATCVIDTGGKLSAGIVDTGGKFATGINNTSKTGGKICRQCCWYRWCTLTCEYLCEFLKNFKTVLMEYSGAGGKMINE